MARHLLIINIVMCHWLSEVGSRPSLYRIARLLIHQPSGGEGSKASDIAIQTKEIVKMRERIAQKIADATGQKLDRVMKDIVRDYWMSTEEAEDYGILGNVISSAKDVKF